MSTRHALIALIAGTLLPSAQAQTLTPEFVAAGYAVADLGNVPGVPTNYGGLTIRPEEPGTLYIGGAANQTGAGLYAIGLVRDGDGHITGFTGTAAMAYSTPNIDGGVLFAPNGTLLYTRYAMNMLGQVYGAGLTSSIALGPLGVAASVGSVAIVPQGFAAQGSLVVASYNSSNLYRLPWTIDADGQYLPGTQNATVSVAGVAGGPEGITYIPPGSPGFDAPSMAISSYGSGRVVVFEVDGNGLPVTGTARDLVSGMTGAEGALIDPVTGDFLFSTFGGGNRVILIKGFADPNDCAGVPFGQSILDECGVCHLPDDPDFNSTCTDCDGVVNGEAFLDNCGDCVGGTTGEVACVQDCNGEWGGTAFLDNCGDCVGGTTGEVACVQDCNGEWGGTAFLDNCGDCVGGTTGEVACVQDCNGEWGGSAFLDNCGDCVGGTTGEEPCVNDCAGVPGGTAFLDNCGDCVGGDTGEAACVQDCNGEWGGEAYLDNCNDCVGGGTGMEPCLGQEGTAMTCSDGIDNDGDGLIDCDDPQCQQLYNNLGCVTCFWDGLSFADVVLEYVNTCPNNTATEPGNALGMPDYAGSSNDHVSLGRGHVKLGFTNNTLINSGDDEDDLFVFEVGPLVEPSFIELRPANAATEAMLIAEGIPDLDGDGFYEFGGIGGSTAGVDIDSFFAQPMPFNSIQFDAIKIVDGPGTCSTATPGADIDAVCALSSLTCAVGQPCDDGDPLTENDVYTINCDCVGTPIYDCPELEANNGDSCLADGTPGIVMDCACQVQDCNGDLGGTAYLDDCGDCVGGTTGEEPCVNDCAGVPGGSAFIDNCGDCVGGTTGEEPCVNDCAGVPGGTAYLDNCGDCVGGTTGETACVQDCTGAWGGTALPGTPCDDGNGNTGNDTWTANCDCVGTPVGDCTNDLVIEFATDANGAEIAWSIEPLAGGDALCGGAMLPNDAVVTATCCLPDGCYRLVVTDAGGDGIAGGGYVLRTVDGDRIIDNAGNFSTGGTSSVADGFCVPLGDDRPIHTSCDRFWWIGGNYLVATENAAVSAQYGVSNTTSGYEFWFFDPNGGLSFRKFRDHATSDGFAPNNAVRAAHIKLNNWAAAQHLLNTVVYNVRIRGVIDGVELPFGPACRVTLDPVAAACTPTGLNDITGHPNFSCGVSRTWGGPNSAANRVYARSVGGANKYEFEFSNANEGYLAVLQSNTVIRHLNWSSQPALNVGSTYTVRVRASKDGGATWCSWGWACDVTIAPGVVPGGESFAALGQTGVSLWPNPNNGRQLWMAIDGLPDDVRTIAVDVHDLSGKRVMARGIALPTGQAGAQHGAMHVDLGGLASGTYVVAITAGGQRHVERLVIVD